MTGASILVVDDDPGVLRLAKRTLERESFHVSSVASGAEAIEWLGGHRADLLLLDLRLADIEARDVIARLEAEGRLPDFMIITGQGDERVAVEMMQRGALDYVVKDRDFLESLPARVRRGLEQIVKERRLEQLEREVLQISETEQRRIGQDLHDGICQRLFGIELLTEALEKKVARKSKTLAAQLAVISRHVREVAGQTRSLAHGLSPLALGAEGLAETLRDFAGSTEELFLVTCRFKSDVPVSVGDYAAATHLYRIAQEAVTNAIKHGHASTIEIHLDERPEGIVLRVLDDGRGFTQPAPEKSGMGLHIMHYRANQIAASLVIQSNPPGGVAVICSLPKGTPRRPR
jgi:signal transduction histidine kinase